MHGFGWVLKCENIEFFLIYPNESLTYIVFLTHCWARDTHNKKMTFYPQFMKDFDVYPFSLRRHRPLRNSLHPFSTVLICCISHWFIALLALVVIDEVQFVWFWLNYNLLQSSIRNISSCFVFGFVIVSWISNNSHQRFKSCQKLFTRRCKMIKEFFRIQQDGLYLTMKF